MNSNINLDAHYVPTNEDQKRRGILYKGQKEMFKIYVDSKIPPNSLLTQSYSQDMIL
jgi:hypothetical protein